MFSTDCLSAAERPAIHVYHGALPGPHLLVMAGVHGNETCGIVALERLKTLLDTGAITLGAGTLTLVPCANPVAAALGQRQVDENLNRVMRHHAAPDTYEQKLANILCPLLDAADWALDIHSTNAPSTPYAFWDYDAPGSAAWLRNLGVPHVVTGWPELYPPEAGESSTGDYAASIGKTCLTLECGQHLDPTAINMAFNGVLRTLAHFGLLDAPVVAAEQRLETAHLTDLFRKADGEVRGPNFPRGNLVPVAKGAVLVFNEKTGGVKRAPYDALAFLPKLYEVPSGTDWLYLARRM